VHDCEQLGAACACTLAPHARTSSAWQLGTGWAAGAQPSCCCARLAASQVIPLVGGVDVTPIVWVALISFFSEILLGPQVRPRLAGCQADWRGRAAVGCGPGGSWLPGSEACWATVWKWVAGY